VIRSVRDAFVGDATLTERQGGLLVVGSGVMFSMTTIAYAAVDEASEIQFLAYRGASTGLAMVILVALRRRHRPVDFSAIAPASWVAGVVLAGTSMLYILALGRTTAATTVFLLAAAPIVAAVIGWLWLGERVARSTILAIASTSIGVTITVGAGLDVGAGTGLLFASLIPVSIGIYSVLMRSAPDVDPVVPTLIAGSVLAVVAGTAALMTDGLAVSLRDAALATLSGGIALGIGLPFFNLGHRSVPAARVPLLLMTEVVLAPLWVWIWPGEVPSAATLVGGAVILASVVGLVVSTRPRAAPVAAR
jgi:drug/metabolite transporter (DMT)-like permease